MRRNVEARRARVHALRAPSTPSIRPPPDSTPDHAHAHCSDRAHGSALRIAPWIRPSGHPCSAPNRASSHPSSGRNGQMCPLAAIRDPRFLICTAIHRADPARGRGRGRNEVVFLSNRVFNCCVYERAHVLAAPSRSYPTRYPSAVRLHRRNHPQRDPWDDPCAGLIGRESGRIGRIKPDWAMPSGVQGH